MFILTVGVNKLVSISAETPVKLGMKDFWRVTWAMEAEGLAVLGARRTQKLPCLVHNRAVSPVG